VLDVARIAASAFEDLETALDDGREGQVGGLVESINRALARRQNDSLWWRQDRDFELSSALLVVTRCVWAMGRAGSRAARRVVGRCGSGRPST
jgi:hypothetical protein